MGGAKRNESTGPFSKLKGPENYKEWAREMGFALQDAGLMSYANGTSAKPKLYTEEGKGASNGSAPLSDEQIEKREAEVEEWILNDSRTCGKIGRMCTSAVQQQLKDTWTAKEIWDNLRANCLADSRDSKWQILTRLEEASYNSNKNMSDFGFTMRTLLEELIDASITFEDLLTVKIINSLGPNFETYVAGLNEKARNNDKKLPDLDALLRSLQEEEVGKSSWDNTRSNSSDGSSRGCQRARGRGSRGGRSGRSGARGGS